MPALLKNISTIQISQIPNWQFSAGSLILLRVEKNYDGIKVLSHLRDTGSRDFHFGRVIYRPGGYTGPRVQRDYELIILHSGEAVVELDESPPKPLKIESIALFLPGHHEFLRIRPEATPITPGAPSPLAASRPKWPTNYPVHHSASRARNSSPGSSPLSSRSLQTETRKPTG
jgi:hypothetical protein